MWMRMAGVLMVVIGGTLAALAIFYMFEQDRAIRTFAATPAVVDRSWVEVHRGKNTSYSPEVWYHYRVQGRLYSSSTVQYIGSSGGSSWAYAVVHRFPEGADVTAYVDPQDPASAMLVRQYASPPYWGALVAMAAVVLGVMMAGGLLRPRVTGMRAVPLGDSGYQLLLPGRNLRQRRRTALAWAVLWMAGAGFVGAHYVMRAQNYDAGGILMLIAVAGVGVMLLVWAGRRWALLRLVSDARLQVNPVPVIRGNPVHVQIEWDTLRALHVESVTAQLVCVEHYQERRGNKTQTGTRTRGERLITLSGPVDVPADSLLEGQGSTDVPPDWPPTSVDRRYPYYTWEFRVQAKVKSAADYGEKFVVDVAP